ncbi:MAG: segregation/condensation protein A [Cellulomonadaceae bacterium]|jgi:segregation and condensation protein A|nr:segregation/condensation protein A [Cellulomonadaceae bacterium]
MPEVESPENAPGFDRRSLRSLAQPSAGDAETPEAFTVHLTNFTGPFDLLLSLISAREMDITEVALAEVTDEFVAYTTAMETFDLDATSQFLVIAATLLDLKSARLLPGMEDDEESLELLEARDVLFARLLQYRAYKEMAAYLAEQMERVGRSVPRVVPLEPQFAAVLPELTWTTTAIEFAALAALALQPKAAPVVDVAHLHVPQESVAEHRAILRTLLRGGAATTFRSLVAGQERAGVIARFLALLDLYRDAEVTFDQVTPLGELTVRLTAHGHT